MIHVTNLLSNDTMRTLLYTLSLLFIVIVSSPMSIAKNQQPRAIITESGALLAQDSYTLSFVRKNHTLDNTTYLRLTGVGGAINGCMTVQGPLHVTETRGIFLWITLSPALLDIDKNSPNGRCAQTMKTPVTDIPIDITSIRENNITMIAFETSLGVERFKIEHTENSIRLTPSGSGIIRSAKPTPTNPEPLSYVFYPENTLILYSPDAHPDQDIKEALKTAAKKNGLSVEPDFLETQESDNRIYAIDTTGRFADSLDSDTSVSLGTISAQRRNARVFARLPGLYE